jgi:Radical SAM superfamily/B12 binding domain
LDFGLQGLKKVKVELPTKPSDDVENMRHQAMMDAIAPYAKKVQQSNATPVYIDYKTRNTKLVLVMCPEWAPDMPPFNLARLSGIAKSAGYETHILDLNIRTYNLYRRDWRPKKKLPFRLWDPSATWHWLGDTYWKDIHPLLGPVLDAAIDEILALKPDVVGFTQYYTSEQPTNYMASELKRRAPNIITAVGGSNVQKDWFNAAPYYDYVVNGEGEQVLLTILDDIENKKYPSEQQFIRQPEEQRISINDLPMPDYESIDFSQYKVPNGVNSEISRGCTAKCTFCEETHFWKYRQRQAVDLIKEIEWLYYNKGTDVIWFIDSLVNGNLKELRAFCKAVQAKQLPIHWTGYSRCDGRMDMEYFRDLKAGGCIILNYGIESGSQKVLDSMAKGVTIAEMEQNFRDGKTVGIYAATNWIVGFPTEEHQDFADSMTLLWRIRNMNVNNIGAGLGFGLGPETIVGQNPEKFNLSDFSYMNHWITRDFKLGGTHVMSRVKSFYTFIDLMRGTTDMEFGYPVRDNLEKEHYKIKLNTTDYVNNDVGYEKFDYNIIKPNLNPFADTLVNEMWPFFRMLWRARGGYEAEIYFNPEIDLKEFGTQYGPGMYTATFKFKITDEGQWTADFDFVFEQIKLPPYQEKDPDRCGPFYFQDFTRLKSNTAIRARKLAKPKWSQDTGRDDMEYWALLQEEVKLNAEKDFSFKYHYLGTGDWSNWKDYAVEVSTLSATPIPEKETMHTIPITSIKRSNGTSNTI